MPNAVAERFTPVRSAAEQAAARERHGLPARFALYFGNTDGKKNLAGTLAGWVRHVRETPAALELVVADLARPRLLEMLSTLGASDLAPLIHAPGYIPQADLPAVYTQTTAYLYPSRCGRASDCPSSRLWPAAPRSSRPAHPRCLKSPEAELSSSVRALRKRLPWR